MITPKEKALRLCQEIGKTTMFDEECNGGYTLPLHISKKIALIAVNEILSSEETVYAENADNGTQYLKFWNKVKEELQKL